MKIVALVVAGVAAALLPILAIAQSETGTTVGIVAVPNAPVAITACKIQNTDNHRDEFNGNVVFMNRTKHALADVRIAIVAYDGENVRMDQQGLRAVLSEPLASGDSTSSRVYVHFHVAGREALVSRVACRVQGAVFSGNRQWTFGQTWAEKLLPLHPEAMTSVQGEGRAVVASAQPVSRANIAVTNALNDVLNGVTVVHVALSLSAGDSSTLVRPTDVQLTMLLANGLKKTYTALARQAPTYQKLNPLGSTPTTAYEVTPSEDFGLVGPITVPAHGEGRITATFVVPEQLLNPNDNRTVSLR